MNFENSLETLANNLVRDDPSLGYMTKNARESLKLLQEKIRDHQGEYSILVDKIEQDPIFDKSAVFEVDRKIAVGFKRVYANMYLGRIRRIHFTEGEVRQDYGYMKKEVLVEISYDEDLCIVHEDSLELRKLPQKIPFFNFSHPENIGWDPEQEMCLTGVYAIMGNQKTRQLLRRFNFKGKTNSDIRGLYSRIEMQKEEIDKSAREYFFL